MYDISSVIAVLAWRNRAAVHRVVRPEARPVAQTTSTNSNACSTPRMMAFLRIAIEHHQAGERRSRFWYVGSAIELDGRKDHDGGRPASKAPAIDELCRQRFPGGARVRVARAGRF